MPLKTNVMRILDSTKISYKTYDYSKSDVISGGDVAKYLQQDPERVFKTLVTQAKSKEYYVFMVPVCCELDLKKAAQAVGEKALEMIPQKELLKVTGYIHGGCSPIGMKKSYRLTIHQSAENFQTIIFSAGKVGYQVELSPCDLGKIVPFELYDIVKGRNI
ncbi:MAG: Cys-tRNA(Pro) deacylase [Ruminococcus sp.]|nr:Cys-tRNA(Pro) deacylase [Ruminococcus sp.]